MSSPAEESQALPVPVSQSPEPKPKVVKNRKVSKKVSVSQLDEQAQLPVVNLAPVFEAAATEPVQNQVENETNAMEIDEESVVDEFEQIPNEK